ncbi:hypothetical protein J2Z50_004804 [Ensifer mexicanus]|nr:hypothetical protein [Sinorhizobium mexicanum]
MSEAGNFAKELLLEGALVSSCSSFAANFGPLRSECPANFAGSEVHQ